MTGVLSFWPGAPGEIAAVAPEEAVVEGGPTDLDVLIDRLEAGASGTVHQVWVPPLERHVGLAEVAAVHPFWERDGMDGARLPVPVGLRDVPAEQRTEPLVLDFAGSAGHLAIVGAPQTGKSAFLRTLVTSLVRTHTPAAVQVYCVDLGGGALTELEDAPHVGGVCTKLDRERVRQTIRHVQALIEERELTFRRFALSSMADVRAQRARGELEVELPDVFLLVDNWASMRHDFEGLDQDVEQIANAGLNYGVHVLLSANRWAEIRPHLRDNIGSRLELRLNDPIDSELGQDGRAPSLRPKLAAFAEANGVPI